MPRTDRSCSSSSTAIRRPGRFTQGPTEMGPATTAVFDDTCGNLIQIVHVVAP